jgi:hypothetical protein
MQFELTLNSDDETILDIQHDQALDSGILSVNLEDTDVSLKPDVSYEWVIALIPDPDDRAKDITSSTIIQRTSPTEELNARLKQASLEQHPYIYAEAGIWYDALKSIEQAIKEKPDNSQLILDRIQLFEQVSLQKVVDCEKQKLSDSEN